LPPIYRRKRRRRRRRRTMTTTTKSVFYGLGFLIYGVGSRVECGVQGFGHSVE